MPKNTSLLPDELLADIKDFFLSNNIELTELARRSSELFGRKIGIETLRDISDNDPGGTWYVQRQALMTSNMSFNEQADRVRNVIFNNLMKPDTPASAVASLAKAWLDMSKNVENGRSSSAKTSPERAIELAKKAEKLVKEFESNNTGPESN